MKPYSVQGLEETSVRCRQSVQAKDQMLGNSAKNLRRCRCSILNSR